jgi:mRNA interferase MazF
MNDRVKRGEVWLADLSPTIGHEQAGRRPVVITSSDFFNRGFAGLVYAVPVTSRDKSIRSHVKFVPPEGGVTVESFIMCEAMRSISDQRLVKRMGLVSPSTMGEVESILRMLLDL